MKQLMRTCAVITVLVGMLAAYVTAGGLVLLAAGTTAATVENRRNVTDYTKTLAFRQTTRDYFDALYRAVTTDTPLELPYGDGIAYFAYGMETNRVYCSDPLVKDLPSFEETYTPGESYIYVCRYSSDVFRGACAVTGETETFTYTYAQAATTVFDGVIRNYTDAVIVIAVPAPEGFAFAGYGYALVQFFVLQKGVMYAVLLLGVFLASLALVILCGQTKQRIERALSRAVAWVYAEVKLAILALSLWAVARVWTWLPDERMVLTLFFLLGPVVYLLYCNIRYYGTAGFFRNSLVSDFLSLMQWIISVVVPVSPLQIQLRTRAIRYFLFCFVFPIIAFFLCDLVLGPRGLWLMIPFYMIWFLVMFVLFFRRYAMLVNDVTELERLTALLPMGEALPETLPTANGELALLTRNISEIDRAVEERAQEKFAAANQRLASMSGQILELREQILALAAQENNPEQAEKLRRLAENAESLYETSVWHRTMVAPVLKRMDLLPLIDSVINAKLPQLIAAQVTVKVKLPPPPVYITADGDQIASALDILLEDLAKYTLSGSRVELEIRREGMMWRFILIYTVSPAATAEHGEAESSVGLTLAGEYLALNGGSLEYTKTESRFGVSFLLPAAR